MTTKTSNLGLKLVNFNVVPWHDDTNDNWRLLDTAVSIATGVSGLEGAWENGIDVLVGEKYFDVETLTAWEVLVSHTTPQTGTFEDARAAEPSYWQGIGTGLRFRGEWTTATAYVANDLAYDSGEQLYCVCLVAHTSTTSMRDDIANWGVIADGGSVYTEAEVDALLAPITSDIAALETDVALKVDTTDLTTAPVATAGVDYNLSLKSSAFVRSLGGMPNVIDRKLTADADYTGAFQRATATGKIHYVPAGSWAISADVIGTGAFFFDPEAAITGTGTIYSRCFSPYDEEDAIVNGAFVYWPEGTLFNDPVSGSHLAGVHKILYDGTSGTFEASLGGGPLSVGATNGLRWHQIAAGVGSTFRLLEHRIEDASVFNSTKATLSWGFTNSGASPVTVSVYLIQYFGSGGSPSADVTIGSKAGISVPVGSSRHVLTVDVPSTAGKTFGSNFNDCVKVQFYLPPTGVFDLTWWEMKYQRGPVRTPYKIIKYNEIIKAVERFVCIKRIALSGLAAGAGEYAYEMVMVAPMRGAAAPTVTYSFGTKINLDALDPRTNFSEQTTGCVSVYVQSAAAGAFYGEGYVKLDTRL